LNVDSGAVHEDIDIANGSSNVRKERFDALSIRDVKRVGSDRMFARDRTGETLERLDATTTHRDLTARCGQTLGDSCTDSSSATRDRDDFSC
jgi:hypothetical protein